MRASKIRPILILGAAVAVVFLLMILQRSPEERVQETVAPLVRTVLAQAQTYRYEVRTQGSVSPRIESELVPQVSGEIIEISPAFAAGGHFEAGELLARIDPSDYTVERETAAAQVARAKSTFGRARKERERQRKLAGQSIASESRIDDAENDFRIAEASLREAEARLRRAQRDLDRTEIRAPYRGRVRREQADVGQFVSRGNAIATVYAVDFAEIRLPLPDRELAYLEQPLGPLGAAKSNAPAGVDADANTNTNTNANTNADADADESGTDSPGLVQLRAEYAGAWHSWTGRLVRTEAELDPTSRMVHLVAQVEDPFGLETQRSAPLAIGLFVEATIEGKRVEDAFVLPRDALREGNQIYVVDAEDTLRFRDVTLLRTERDHIVIGSGLAAGDRVCVSPLQAVVDGMQLRVVEADEAGS